VAAPGDIRDDPARAKLAQVLALIYLPPPVGEEGGDALASGNPDPSRMFVLVHPLEEQGAGDRDRLKRLGLQYHAVRVPAAAPPPQQQPGGAAAGIPGPRPLPWQVFPMRDVLRVVRVGPAAWPAFHADADGRYTTARQQRKYASSARRLRGAGRGRCSSSGRRRAGRTGQPAGALWRR